MTADMNASRASEVWKRPVSPGPDSGLYLWLIVGCSLGGALLLTLIIAALIYARRRRGKAACFSERLLHPTYIPGSNFCPQQMMSSLSSSASDDTAIRLQPHCRRPLGPSASLDPSSLRLTTSEECVQPRPVLTRWHTVASTPHTAAVLMERDDSDEEARPSSSPHGRLWFSLDYKAGQLEVMLHKAKHLPGRGLSNSPRDPFVKVFLLPEEETFQQSKIRRRTLSPRFHETFTFTVGPIEVRRRTLKLSVYDVDKRKVRHCLGHVIQPLDRLEDLKGSVLCRELDLAPQSSDTSLPGEVQLCLSCNPLSNRIKVTVCRVRHLLIDGGDTTVSVRVELYHGRRLVKCKRTRTVVATGEGGGDELVFDESFGFGVSSGRFFDSCSLGLVVMSAEEGGGLERRLGRAVVGPFLYARGEQLQHWQEMLANPRSAVTRWHPLRR